MGLAPEENDSRQHLRFNEKTNMKFLISQIATGRLLPNLIISGEYKWSEIDKAYKTINARDNSNHFLTKLEK